MTDTLSPNTLVLQVRKMEKALITHPNVADAVVIPQHSPAGEQRIRAFVEPADPPPSAESILAHFKNDWPDIQVPVDIIFKSIPRTPSGKVIRQQLLDS
ncbi:AMP-binding enzyme [Desulfoscipio geothermicus]|uniref:AMP-binding enzyme C-terminal domain-containing protein n=1 Tax=Desulfoscipio geothermicus DSM 3669 TaxID=1121426 RepID=A0A1I6DQQ6_9FIRM|nr:hypothetical protein [Desulfoscipio geothermicus]SFR07766.1 AMP-binding enzyme C-terminal domain-containing protein [Desulfoscipio geothermicus DSM 3669]